MRRRCCLRSLATSYSTPSNVLSYLGEYLYVHQFEVDVSRRKWTNHLKGVGTLTKLNLWCYISEAPGAGGLGSVTFPEFIKVEVEMVSGLVVTAPPVKEDELVAISTKLENSVIGYTLTMNVDYPSEALACIVKTTLAVDPELQPDKVQREMLVQGARLSVTFTAVEARFLRASFSAFMELLILATRTVEQFGPASSYGQYCHL